MRTRTTGNPGLAVAYLRVSTEDQNLGPEAQRSAITSWAVRQGVQVVAWHEDRGVSGATPVAERSGLCEALAAVRASGAGLLVAMKRDRLARDVAVAATIETLAGEAGARVVTADGVAVEDTPEGRLMRGMLDLFAAYERDLIRARTKAALQAKRVRGERVSGRAPVGFRFEAGRLVPNNDELGLVAQARALRAKGLSLRRVADLLNADGEGRRWHVTTLRRVLGA